MAAESFTPAERAEYYRQLAAVIRTRSASTKTSEARDAFDAVASDYELLAHYAESLGSTWQTLRRRPDTITAAE